MPTGDDRSFRNPNWVVARCRVRGGVFLLVRGSRRRDGLSGGIAPASARVAVLIANVLVAGIAWGQFWRAGHFDWRVLLSFAIISVPCAWLGSRIHISPQVYKIVLGVVLAVAGVTL